MKVQAVGSRTAWSTDATFDAAALAKTLYMR
jgi:hypothetical protein